MTKNTIVISFKKKNFSRIKKLIRKIKAVKLWLLDIEKKHLCPGSTLLTLQLYGYLYTVHSYRYFLAYKYPMKSKVYNKWVKNGIWYTNNLSGVLHFRFPNLYNTWVSSILTMVLKRSELKNSLKNYVKILLIPIPNVTWWVNSKS